jgi:adenine-specific DNA-methyltransferase
LIKYLGSKRKLVPVLAAVADAVDARRALDLFSGTSRVGSAWKAQGAHVTAVDMTRTAHVLARCYVATDATALNGVALAGAIEELDRLPGQAGYVTEVFCRNARYFQPANGERIDAIRTAIAERWAGSDLEPVLLTALLEAADRVDSTTGVQMAYLKSWAPRSRNPLRLRAPELLPGPGVALRGDAVEVCAGGGLGAGGFELAYLDPPYNQHSYPANYHVWETIVAADEPDHLGVACKRADTRSSANASAFNRRATIAGALAAVLAGVDAGLVALSYNDEAWVAPGELVDLCAANGRRHVELVGFDSPRYVGARIGIHNPAGAKVGEVTRTRNVEYLVLASESPETTRAAARAARSATPLGNVQVLST